MIRLLMAGLLLWVGGCARKQSASQPAPSASQSAAAPAVTLERTACFGGCPVYTLSVSPEGEVRFEGKAHVRWLGSATGRVSKARVDSLLFELDRAGYFSFADRYTAAEPTCGRYATDSPSAITSVTLRGKTKRIAHDYGCGGAPGALVVLERRIDEVLDSGRWTGR
jgi:uncharacterized protein DUF6438